MEAEEARKAAEEQARLEAEEAAQKAAAEQARIEAEQARLRAGQNRSGGKGGAGACQTGGRKSAESWTYAEAPPGFRGMSGKRFGGDDRYPEAEGKKGMIPRLVVYR